MHGCRSGQTASKFAEDHGGLPAQVIQAVYDYYSRHRAEVDEYVRAGEVAGEDAYQKILALPGHAEALAALKARIAKERARRAELDAQRPD